MDKAIKMLTDIKNASSVFGIRPDEIDEALAELKAYEAKFQELEAIAQKMKCCMNCDGQGDREDNYYCFLADCDNLSLWRLKDNK